tara:strand:+ start:1191 stop:1571 length:381 start_codon:yes stop_codon:yes gene_type:complete
MKKYQKGGIAKLAAKAAKKTTGKLAKVKRAGKTPASSKLKRKSLNTYKPGMFGVDVKKGDNMNRMKYPELQKPKFKSGGSLKSVPAGKKFNGLRSLPTDVRNKMGYAQYGGMKMMKGGSLRRSKKH